MAPGTWAQRPWQTRADVPRTKALTEAQRDNDPQKWGTACRGTPSCALGAVPSAVLKGPAARGSDSTSMGALSPTGTPPGRPAASGCPGRERSMGSLSPQRLLPERGPSPRRPPTCCPADAPQPVTPPSWAPSCQLQPRVQVDHTAHPPACLADVLRSRVVSVARS